MAISLEVPITAYTRGGTALVSSPKRKTEPFNQKTSKEKQQNNNFSPKHEMQFYLQRPY
jgi:hypothetical protein